MDKKEIDLDNPVFVYYLNVNGMTHQQVDEMTRSLNEVWSFDNVVTWIVPRREGETKLECVYDGRVQGRSDELKELVAEINDKIEILSGSNDFEDFKIAVRDWRINNLLR